MILTWEPGEVFTPSEATERTWPMCAFPWEDERVYPGIAAGIDSGFGWSSVACSASRSACVQTTFLPIWCCCRSKNSVFPGSGYCCCCFGCGLERRCGCACLGWAVDLFAEATRRRLTRAVTRRSYCSCACGAIVVIPLLFGW